jgi:hypothetical protein
MTDLATTGTAVADAMFELLESTRGPLGIVDVWYGDQRLFPHTPALCVVLGSTDIELVGAPRRVQDTYNIQLKLYHGKIAEVQELERECNVRAELVRSFIDNYDSGRLGGLVIDSMVTSIEPGFANIRDNWYKTSRINWSGMSRYLLTFEP